MYGETGAAMRQAFAELLRQHRVQQRLGGTPTERADLGQQIRRYRQTVLLWCSQAVDSLGPLMFSNQVPAQANPFRSVGPGGRTGSPAGELARALHLAKAEATARAASVEELTTPTGHPSLEHWRTVARAAALAEHDTAPDVATRMTVSQAQAVLADVAAITQALVVLDQRYRHTPGWEKLAKGDRLGWAALATALDVNLGQPDYTVDTLGWRLQARPIAGPARPGILGVLQAEHNLVSRMKSFPNATNLRYVVDSQRLLSRHLVPYGERIDQRLADRWSARAETYARLQQQLRSISGQLGKGGPAAAEGANAVSRIRALRPDTIVEPRALGGFQLLFDRLDQRIADVIETGIDTRAYLQRVRLPLLEGTGDPNNPVRAGFIPVDRATRQDLVELIRGELRPHRTMHPVVAGQARADLHAALVHRAPARGSSSDAPHL